MPFSNDPTMTLTSQALQAVSIRFCGLLSQNRRCCHTTHDIHSNRRPRQPNEDPPGKLALRCARGDNIVITIAIEIEEADTVCPADAVELVAALVVELAVRGLQIDLEPTVSPARDYIC